MQGKEVAGSHQKRMPRLGRSGQEELRHKEATRDSHVAFHAKCLYRGGNLLRVNMVVVRDGPQAVASFVVSVRVDRIEVNSRPSTDSFCSIHDRSLICCVGRTTR